MAKSEEQKAARRARRALARKEQEEAMEKWEKIWRERAGPGPYDNVICYRCQEKGHYAAMCGKRDEGKKSEGQRYRSKIFCFKCRSTGHFPSRCQKVKKVNAAPTASVDQSTICYHCRLTGHIARNCPVRKYGRKAAFPQFVKEDGCVVHLCKKCRSWGHIEGECSGPIEGPPGRINTDALFM